MRVVKLCDIPLVMAILQSHYGKDLMEGMEAYLSSAVRVHNYLISSDNSILIMVERIGNFKAQFHFYALPEKSFKSKIEFARQCIIYLFSSTNYTSLLTFIPEGNKGMEKAVTFMGLKLIGSVPSAGGIDSAEKIYSLSKKKEEN